MSNEVNIFEFLDKQYIQPELERRRTNSNLPDGFQIRECLIQLPEGKEPIVLFNQEFRWVIKPKLAPGVSMNEGIPVYLHEVVDMDEVLPPMVDGKQVTFFYLFWNGLTYSIVVAPNNPFPSDSSFNPGKAIAEHLRNHFKEMV